jgi:hypothetical protein
MNHLIGVIFASTFFIFGDASMTLSHDFVR